MTIVLVLMVAYIALVVLANRSVVPHDSALPIGGADVPNDAQRRLTVFNWNIGYAGLGRESEFIADGGNSLLAPSRAAVDKNLAGISRVLSTATADVFTLQEVAETSFLNYWRPVWTRIVESLPGKATVWYSDVRSVWMPWPAKLDHGMATLLSLRASEARLVALPLEPGFWFGLLRKQYALLVTHIPIAGDSRNWVVVNLHLAAFDIGGETRRRQLRAVTDFAVGEYRKGNLVVLAGDWNMVLGGKSFDHRTDQKFLDWVHSVPSDAAPDGWRFVFDPNTPTVRTLHKPYLPNDNFVTIIDGFLISPNIEVEAVTTYDLGFENSDHNPVLGTFRAK